MPNPYPPYQHDFLEPGTRRVSKVWHQFFLHLVGGAPGGLDGGLITGGTVPLDALVPIDSPRLLGRGTTGVGPVEVITIGDGLTMTETTLSVTAEAVEALGYWTVLTDGDVDEPDLICADGEAIAVFVPTPP